MENWDQPSGPSYLAAAFSDRYERGTLSLVRVKPEGQVARILIAARCVCAFGGVSGPGCVLTSDPHAEKSHPFM